MITAVDTNILLDILVPGAPQANASERSLNESLVAGSVILSEAVYAELAVHFPSHDELKAFLEDVGIRLRPSGNEALYMAGDAWRDYLSRRADLPVCPACGTAQEQHCGVCGASFRPRRAIVADFLIGAHASIHADRLLTRDRGYYRTYFPSLKLV